MNASSRNPVLAVFSVRILQHAEVLQRFQCTHVQIIFPASPSFGRFRNHMKLPSFAKYVYFSVKTCRQNTFAKLHCLLSFSPYILDNAVFEASSLHTSFEMLRLTQVHGVRSEHVLNNYSETCQVMQWLQRTHAHTYQVLQQV